MDPYSSSKACAELVVSSYRRSFFADTDCGLATARAGNVIGGGDWSADRLVPDAVRAVASGSLMRVRNASAVRPWQHVLSPLAGYLLLAQRLFAGEPVDRPWNFGPRPEDEQTVGWVVQRLAELWDGELQWELDTGEQLAETAYLALDSSAAEGDLGWVPACSLARAGAGRRVAPCPSRGRGHARGEPRADRRPRLSSGLRFPPRAVVGCWT